MRRFYSFLLLLLAGVCFYCVSSDSEGSGYGGHENTTRINGTRGYNFSCNFGHTGNGTHCQDIDECSFGPNTCHENAACVNTDGGYECSCNSGYTGNGTECKEINECLKRNHTCHDNATCNNTIGSFECLCNEGFNGTGFNCTDIDECNNGLHDCHENAACINFDGGYNCYCTSGDTGNGTDYEVHLAPPNVSDVESHSFIVRFCKPINVSKFVITVAPRHAKEPKSIRTTTGNETFTNLKDGTIYYVTINGENSKGRLGRESEVTEVRTMPLPPAIHLSRPLSTSVLLFLKTKNYMSVSQWIIRYRKAGFPTSEISFATDPGEFGAYELSGLLPDTNYQIQARVSQLYHTLNTSEYKTPFSAWTDFKTDSLSIFGRVVLKNLSYENASEISVEAYLVEAYGNLSSYIHDINIVEIENNTGNPLVHYKLKVRDKSLPSRNDYQLIGSGYADSAITSGNFGNWYQNEYDFNNPNCSELIEESSLVTYEDEETVELKLNSLNKLLSTFGQKNGTQSKIVGLTVKLLVKKCLKNANNLSLYAEYFHLLDENSTNLFLTAGTTTLNESAITYSSSPSGDSVTLNLPAVDKAVRYQIFNTSHVVATLEEHDIDGSSFLKIPILSLVNGTTYNFSADVTTRGQNGNLLVISNSFTVKPDSELCSRCSAGPYCVSSLSGNIECGCDEGFTWKGDILCDEINECLERNHTCHDNATCNNTVGSFECFCNEGFNGTGFNCTDVDECSLGSCDEHANCSNTEGSFSCSCHDGFTGDGVNCNDIDECAYGDSCHTNAMCINSPGNYTCLCNTGYSGDGKNCTDIDECNTTKPCDPYGNCTNTIGSYFCVCHAGFIINGNICVDINECDDDNANDCAENATCTNVPSTYNCTCNIGWIGNGTNCQDFDECIVENNCSSDALCENTVGSYYCECKDGYNGTGLECQDINECLSDPCATDSICTNLHGNYSCLCESGYTGDHYNICGRVEKVQLSGMNEKDFKKRNQGYLEIFSNERWGTICHPEWGEEESKVVCKMLNYKTVSFLPPTVEDKIKKTWIDGINCTGTENDLVNCKAGKFGLAECDGEERVKLLCSDAIGDGNSIKLQYKTKQGVIFDFSCERNEANYLIRSKQSCDLEEIAAVIECRQGGPPENRQLDFDYLTFREFDCNTTVREILNNIKSEKKHVKRSLNQDGTEAANENSQGTDVVTHLGTLSAITTKLTSNTTDVDDVMMAAEIIIELKKEINAHVKKDTMFYLLWSSDNFNSALKIQKSPGDNSTTHFSNSKKLEYIAALREFASRFQEEKLTIITNSSIFKAITHNSTARPNLYFESATITPPDFMFENGSIGSMLSIYLHFNTLFFPKPEPPDTFLKDVLCLQGNGMDGGNVSGTGTYSMTHSKDLKRRQASEPGHVYLTQCVSLNGEAWNNEKCKTDVTDKETKCFCEMGGDGNNIGFSALVKVYPVPSSFALHVAGLVGCIASSVGLFFMLVIHLSFRSIRSNQISQIHTHLALCLLVMYMTFIFGIERSKKHVYCVSIAAIMQFSLLSSFGWMLTEAVTMYKKFVAVFSHIGPNYVWKCAAVVYFISAATTVTNVVVTWDLDNTVWGNWTMLFEEDVNFYPSEYIGDRMCWLHKHSLYFGFLAPAGVISLLNFIACIVISKKITGRTAVRSNLPEANICTEIIQVVMVCVILGVSWLLGIPLTFINDKVVNEVFGWLFTIFNAFQGLFISLLFCLKRKDVRSAWVSKFRKIVEKRHEISVSTATTNLQVEETENFNPAIYVATPICLLKEEFKEHIAAKKENEYIDDEQVLESNL